MGPGGVGKTRTALQLAAKIASRGYEVIAYVELAALAPGPLVASTIALALDSREQGSSSPTQTVVATLGSKRALVMLDNCEQIIADAAAVVAATVRGCAQTTVIVTSREPLKIAGERVVRLPSFAVPKRDVALDAGAAADYGAIALLVERATAADHRFKLTDAKCRSPSGDLSATLWNRARNRTCRRACRQTSAAADARTGRPCRMSSRATALPVFPVAPVTRMGSMMSSDLFCARICIYKYIGKKINRYRVLSFS